MLDQYYSFKCDVWSTGIILFTLLMNRVPYDGLKDQEIIDKIKKYNVTFWGPEFDRKSTSCLQALKSMLIREPKLRINAIEAL